MIVDEFFNLIKIIVEVRTMYERSELLKRLIESLPSELNSNSL